MMSKKCFDWSQEISEGYDISCENFLATPLDEKIIHGYRKLYQHDPNFEFVNYSGQNRQEGLIYNFSENIKSESHGGKEPNFIDYNCDVKSEIISQVDIKSESHGGKEPIFIDYHCDDKSEIISQVDIYPSTESNEEVYMTETSSERPSQDFPQNNFQGFQQHNFVTITIQKGQEEPKIFSVPEELCTEIENTMKRLGFQAEQPNIGLQLQAEQSNIGLQMQAEIRSQLDDSFWKNMKMEISDTT